MRNGFSPLTLAEVSFSNLLSKAWEILKKEWAFLLGVFIAMLVLQFIVQAVQTSLMESSSGLAFLVAIALWIFSMIVSMGWINIYIKAARGESMEFSDIFSKYPRFLTYLISNLVVGLIVFVGFILLIVPGIILSLKYLFVPYLVVDKKIGISQAFKASSQMTDGMKWRLLGYAFGFFGLMILGLLALFVGIFVVMPLMMIAYGVLYNALLEKVEPELLITPAGNTSDSQADTV